MIIGRNFWRHFGSQRWKYFEFLLVLFQVYEVYEMAVSSSKACKVKSRVKTANSECRSLLHTFLVFVPLHFSIYCVHLPLSQYI